MKRLKIVQALLALVSLSATAQQDPQYTQYMYNTVNVNPAYAGSRGALSIFGLHRTQWAGLEGAPQTNAFSVNTPLGDSKVGLGVGFVNDALGIIDENTISVDVSYTVDLNNYGSKLAFGLKGSGNFLNVAYSELLTYNPNDHNFETDIKGQFNPNIGAGIYWHNNKSYLGFSIPNMLQTTRFDDNIQSTMQQRMNYYFIGGHVFEINPVLLLKPTFLVKATKGAPLQADFSANLLVHEKLTVGAAYRWDAAWSAMLGYQITNGLFVGYGYDADTTKFANYNNGSHELFLRFELFNMFRKVNTPRFF